jgi:GNAT superfamily N-acetyltransferase
MKVRLAVEADIPEIVRMGRLFWNQTPYRDVVYCPDSIAFISQQMMDQGLLLFAEVEGKPAGSVGAMASPLYANRTVMVAAELWWWVEPEYRNTGIGKLMLMEMEKAAKEAGVYRFAMMAFEEIELEKAAAVYRKFGYVPTERSFGKIL